MAEIDREICILCNKEITEDKTRLAEKAIKSLIKASKEIGDKKHLKMKDLAFLNVHNGCKIIYTRPTHIKTEKKAISDKLAQIRRESKEARKFDFKSLCIFCLSDATTDTHKRPIKLISRDDMKTNILKALESRPNNDFNRKLKFRLQWADDKQIKTGRYHARCMQEFYLTNPCARKIRGRPMSENMSEVVQHVINHILGNSDDSQFSLKEMIEDFRDNLPRIDHIKEHLKKYFEDDIVMHSVHNDTIICFVDRKGKALDDQWYEKKAPTVEEERLRIVEMAAQMIYEDIRSRHYDTGTYNKPSSFLDDVEKDVPKTLQVFLETLIKNNKKSVDSSQSKWSKRVSTIAHILISCVRPRTFMSSILLGLSSLIHKKFAARGLLDTLSYLGLSASYHETLQFESSIVNDPEQFKISDDAFIQFSFDNADHNTNTIDGFKTFHAMGGIMCVTPSSSVTSERSIKRLHTIPTSTEIGKFGFLPLKLFDRGTSIGLNNMIIKNFDDLNDELNISTADFVWLYQKNTRPLETNGWSGFQEQCHANIDYKTSRIIPIPFVNNPPSDYNTIFTVLVEAAERCKSRAQERCFICFDQPLYLKAREIISCADPANDPHNLKSVTVRLGGFHMLMSFLGSVGFIMKGSGLKEAFCVLFAEKSAEKALDGHAYSRAIRGHTLIQASVAAKIFEEVHLSEEEISCLLKYTEEINKSHEESEAYYNQVICIKKRFIKELRKIEEKGPTCKLWIQYFIMINIVKRFIEAERIGNWKLHLQCVKSMLPFFHASGHHLYAKCSHIYLQDMISLEFTMDIFEYDKFAKCGFFTIRRSEKAWSGIFADMTIEQVLMKSMKTSGGLTHGRGISDSVVAKWILSTIALTEVSNEMEKFCNVSFETSEQHVDTRISRIKRDAEDLQKIHEFFDKYNPFVESNFVMSIYSGIIGNKSINCYIARDEGMKVLHAYIGKSFGNMKASMKNKVRSLHSMNSSVKIQENVVAINPLLIFQRISLNLKNQEDMKNYLQHELAPFPLSLFDENGMRKTTKSNFYDNFECLSESPVINANDIYVLDGGSLLHRVLWQRNILVKEIIDKYVQYVQRQYKKAVIVFDGYPDDTSSTLKTCERLRRQRNNISREFYFDENTKITEKQATFLSNNSNKKRLINMLCVELQSAGFETKIANEDADSLIIQTAAYFTAVNIDNVIVVGEDVDLIVLLTQLIPSTKKIFFLKKGKGRDLDRWYSNNSFKYPELSKYVAFLHAVSGCDTVSSFYKQGKNKIVKMFNFNHDYLQLIDVFYQKNSLRDDISKNMCQIISLLYCNKKNGTLNEHRYEYFKRSTSRASFQLENLPPTEGAARQHAYRVYLQLQKWLGNDNDVTQWGWKVVDTILMPVYSEEPLIPEEIIKKISCSCASGCKTKVCGCKKNFLKCTSVCLHCDSAQCENFETPPNIEIDEDSLDAFEKLLDENVEEEEQQQENESEDNNPIKKRKIEST